MGNPQMKFSFARTSNELQWLHLNTGYQESMPCNGQEDDLFYSLLASCTMLSFKKDIGNINMMLDTKQCWHVSK